CGLGDEVLTPSARRRPPPDGCPAGHPPPGRFFLPRTHGPGHDLWPGTGVRPGGRVRGMRLPSASLLLFCLLACTSVAHAWNGAGHRLVANLAEPHLSPEARAEVRRLLALEGASGMADVASWADELRGTGSELGKRSSGWHFVNMAEDGCAFDAARHCPDGNCVVAAIRDQAAIL